MFRTFFIYLSKAKFAQQLIVRWRFSWKAASRFVAGEKVEDAIQVVQDLNEKGINATLDHLGECTATWGEATQATDEIINLLEAINSSGIRANVSVKLTQIGLALDMSLCSNNLERILKKANDHKLFVRIDMEDTPFTEKTLSLYRQMRDKGFYNTGVVVQSYLYRTEKDTRELVKEGTHIRLVKGAYKETKEVAFPRKKDVNRNFDQLAQIIIDAAKRAKSTMLSDDGRTPPIPAIGSHDPKRLEYAKTYAQRVKLPKQAIEFQMLYGIRRDLQEYFHSQGYPVRIYVPFGTHWYPYFMRRLAERPANLWFFISNYFRK